MVSSYALSTPIVMLSDNFSFTEIWNASHPADDNEILIDSNLVDVAQYIRDATSKPINVSSAYRNSEYNSTINGSSDKSQHIHGKAWDLHSDGIVEWMENAHRNNTKDFENLKSLGLRGVGYYDWGVHVDTRSQSRVSTWDYRKKKENNDLEVVKTVGASFLGLIIVGVLGLLILKR